MKVKKILCSAMCFFLFAGSGSVLAEKKQASNPMLVQQQKINLNTADAKQIAGMIKGIGQKRAQAIVDYRKMHGKFKSFDELASVKGISQRFIKVNRDVLQKTFSIN